MQDRKISLFNLAWPIFVETMLRTTLSSVDIFMLGLYADQAAAAVGAIQNFVFFALIIYTIGATGVSIVLSQYLGARDRLAAGDVARIGIMFNSMAGIVLSIVMRLAMPHVIDSLNLEPIVRTYAMQYLTIYFTFSVFQAVSLMLASILRSHGYSNIPMYVNMGANVLNVLGNYIFLFGPLGLPVLGVRGVAISTVSSQFIGMLVLFIIIARHKNISLSGGHRAESTEYLKKILKVGLPSAGEILSYNLAQVAILYMVTPMGTASLASYTYAITISRFAYILSLSLGGAVQILVGHRVGASQEKLAKTEVRTATLVGMFSSLFIMGLIAISRYRLLSLLTDDPEIIRITSTLLLLAVIYEFGRPINLIVISGLKGAGDAIFPVIVGIIMMWGISVTGAWFLGIYLAMGMTGIWLGRMTDEWLRGLVMVWRWSSGRWQGKSLVEKRQTA